MSSEILRRMVNVRGAGGGGSSDRGAGGCSSSSSSPFPGFFSSFHGFCGKSWACASVYGIMIVEGLYNGGICVCYVKEREKEYV